MSDHRSEHTRRIQIYPRGPVTHPSGDFVVDDGLYTSLREFHDDMSARGYYTPFSFAHKSDGPARDQALEEGLNHGRVVDLHLTQNGIEADVYFAKGVAQMFDSGLIDGVSPAHYTNGFTDPHTGKHYRTGLREVSGVRVPHLKGMARPSSWYQMTEEGADEWRPITALEEIAMAAQTILETKVAQDAPITVTAEVSAITALSESVTKLAAQVKAQAAQIASLAKPKAEPIVTANGEETPSDKRIRELEQRLAAQDVAIKRAEAQATIARRLPTASADLVTSLSEAAIVLESAHLETLLKSQEDALAAKSRTALGAQIKDAASGVTSLGEVGATGSAAQIGGVTRAQARSKARATKIAPGLATERWIAEHYPNAN